MTSDFVCHNNLRAGEVMCGDGQLHDASGVHCWCIWCGLCPWHLRWRCWSWWSCWVPVVEVRSSPTTAVLFHPSYIVCKWMYILDITYNSYSSDNRHRQGQLQLISYNLFIDYSTPKSRPHEVHIGLPHPSTSPTRFTQVLEQKQSRGWVYHCPR